MGIMKGLFISMQNRNGYAWLSARKKLLFAFALTFLALAMMLQGCSGGETSGDGAPSTPQYSMHEEQAPEVVEQGAQLPALFTSDTAVWRFLSGSSAVSALADPARTWTSIDYSDVNWGRGVGSFGAKDGGLGELSGGYLPETLLPQYDSTGNSYPVYLLRTGFAIDTAEQIGSLLANVTYDDAVIIYMNEMEVFRGNVPTDGYASADAYGSYEGAGSPINATFEIPAHMIYPGENVIAVELHQDDPSSSDVFFEFSSLIPITPQITSVNVGVGGDESSVSMSWVGTNAQTVNSYVELIPSTSSTATPVTYEAHLAEQASSGYTYRADLTDLAPDTLYSYTIHSAGMQKTGLFRTGNPLGGVSVMLIGDPQFGSGDLSFDDASSNMLDGILAIEYNTDFAAVLGDISTDPYDATAYAAYFDVMESSHLTSSVIYGNHDIETTLLSDGIYMPNMTQYSATSTEGSMSGNYWYKYGDILFMALNSNSTDVVGHETFLNEAITQYTSLYGEPSFIVVLMHHSMFSSSIHYYEDVVVALRAYMPSVFSALDIDLVLSGHEHIFSRSYLMQGNTPVPYSVTSTGVQKSVGQTLYITAGSSTGSKYYDLSDDAQGQTAAALQLYQPVLTRADFDDNSVMLTTYSSLTGEIVDQFTLTK